MATKHTNDDFDFPDRPVEPIAPPPVLPVVEEFKPEPVTVKPYDRLAWTREHGPQPPGPGLRMLDYMILAMFAGSVLLFIKACTWAVFS